MDIIAAVDSETIPLPGGGASLLVTTLREQSISFLDPSRRTFYLALAVAASVTFWFAWRQQAASSGEKAAGGIRGALRYMLPWKVFNHHSSRLDFQLFFANALFKAFLLTPWLLGSGAVGFAVFQATRELFGRPVATDWPWWAYATLFSVVLFVVEDFSRFFTHYLMHKVPWMWEFHKIHHSAAVMTPLTYFRVHPAEIAIMAIRHSLVLGSVSGVYIALLGSKLTGLEILGVDAFGFIFNLALANLRHSHVPISFGRLEQWILSPFQHQIHHSARRKHFDKNFGVCLAAWDRLFGTFVAAEGERIFRFGLKRIDRRYRYVLGAYLTPFAGWGRSLQATASKGRGRLLPGAPGQAGEASEQVKPSHWIQAPARFAAEALPTAPPPA